MQDVFLSAFESLVQLRSQDHFGGWLASIARNAARRHGRLRAARRMAALPDGVPAPDNGQDPLVLQEVYQALRELPEVYREPLVLRLVEGLGSAEIAAATGLTPGSVRVNLHRGLKKLRGKLAPAPAGQKG